MPIDQRPSRIDAPERSAQKLVHTVTGWFDAREDALWALIGMVFVADIGLTLYGFELGLVESNPLALWLLGLFGVAGIIGLKVGVFGLAVVLRVVIPEGYGVVVPISLLGPWAYAAVSNAVLILRVV